MSFVSLLSFNIRHIIYDFLTFDESKRLLLLNRTLFKEIMVHLRGRQLNIKQSDVFPLEKSSLFSFFRNFPNILHLQLNCYRIDVFYIFPSLPKHLKSLKLVDVNMAHLTKDLFWELLASACNHLEFFSISERYSDCRCEGLLPTEGIIIKNFFNANPSLKKIALKFNRHRGLFFQGSSLLLEAILQVLSNIENIVEELVIQNIPIPPSYLTIRSTFPKICCPKIRHLKVKNQVFQEAKQFGINNETLSVVFDVFPNLEKINFLDGSQQNFNLNLAFQCLTTAYLNNLNKTPKITMKLFHLDCYSSPFEIDEILMMNLLSNCSDLTNFGCASNKLMSNGIFQELIFRNPNLLQINFDFTNFDDLGCTILASSDVLKNLTKISLQFCKRITQEGFSTLLEGCKCLKSLNVKGNKNFKNKVVEFLLQSGELEAIYFHENRIKNSSLNKILKRFQKTLKILEISKLEGYEKITNFVFKELIDDNIKLSRLKNLDVAFNHIIDFNSLKDICIVFPNLERFNVKCCGHFNLECFDRIQNSNWRFTLEKLNIKYCHLFPHQIQEITEKLKNFQKLVHINVDDEMWKSNDRFIFTN